MCQALFQALLEQHLILMPLMGRDSSSLTDEESWAQKGEVACPKSHSRKVAKLGLEPRQAGSGAPSCSPPRGLMPLLCKSFSRAMGADHFVHKRQGDHLGEKISRSCLALLRSP